MDPTNNYYILTFLFGYGETASGRTTILLCFVLSLMLLSILGVFLSKKMHGLEKYAMCLL